MFQFTWTDGTIHHRMPSLSMLQVHIHADAHTHTDNTQIDPDTPHWFPKLSSPTPPDGEPCGNAPCAEVSGWEMGMSQFSEVEWPLPFDLPWCTVVFFWGGPGCKDWAINYKSCQISILNEQSWTCTPMPNGLKHLDCISQVGWVCLVTWNIQVAFCQMIHHLDSGPPMLEELQSPALPSGFPGTPQIGVPGAGPAALPGGAIPGGATPAASARPLATPRAEPAPGSAASSSPGGSPLLPPAIFGRFGGGRQGV